MLSETFNNYCSFPDGGLGDHNYCRNPDDSLWPWCYNKYSTMPRYEYCSIPACPLQGKFTL